ncbi:hypothetical protein [Rhodoblastus sp.]|uniref:hypothetical protein n=1 Tax=Rhodoblastus sp. TaxID=1962975 RepID=UPI0025E78543|nr:hypothetical protein [Rhodoblastus sp.]
MDVVDRLEPVEINDHDSEPVAGLMRLRHPVKQFKEETAVGEPGQRIVARDGFGAHFRRGAAPHGLAQQEGFANGGRDRAEAYTSAQHHEVQKIMAYCKVKEIIEEAEFSTKYPNAIANHHKAKHFI